MMCLCCIQGWARDKFLASRVASKTTQQRAKFPWQATYTCLTLCAITELLWRHKATRQPATILLAQHFVSLSRKCAQLWLLLNFKREKRRESVCRSLAVNPFLILSRIQGLPLENNNNKWCHHSSVLRIRIILSHPSQSRWVLGSGSLCLIHPSPDEF